MKGQSTQLLMFSIIIVGFGVGMLSYAQLSAAPGILAQTVDDVPMVVEAQTQSDNIVEHYIPLAAHYAVAQGVWEESQNNEDIENNGGFNDHFEETIDDATQNSRDKFNNWYIDSNKEFYLGRCTVNVPDKQVDIVLDANNIEIENDGSPGYFVRTTCDNGVNEVVNERSISSIETNTSNIRLHKMLLITLNGTKAAHNEAEEIDSNDDNYGTAEYDTEDSYPTCYSQESTAEDIAEAQAEDEAKDELDSLREDIKDAYNTAIDNMDETASQGLIGSAIEFFTAGLWAPNDEQFRWTPIIEDNTTDVTHESTSSSQCNCEGTWSCSGSNWSPDAPYSSSEPDCEHANTGSSNAQCDFGEHKDGGSCYNTSGYPRSYEGTPDCNHLTGVSHDGFGGCTPDDPTPNPTCSDWTYSAESEYDWEMSYLEFKSDVEDKKYQIPTSDGWKKLELIRTFDESFSTS